MTSRFVRSAVWHLGRKLYCVGRKEGPNNPEINGEYWLLEQVVLKHRDKAPAAFLDIGANKGNWSKRAVQVCEERGVASRIYGFEPARATFEYVSKRFAGHANVSVYRLALSCQSGEKDFYITDDLAGTNSLYESNGAFSERVNTGTVDEFLASEAITHVLFVKSDTEGHDFDVIDGARSSLSKGMIDIWQFEYNHRWISSRRYLKDIFAFIADKPYELGKLYGNGIEIYEQWHPELERYFETNYVLVRKGGPFGALCSMTRFNPSNVAVPCNRTGCHGA